MKRMLVAIVALAAIAGAQDTDSAKKLATLGKSYTATKAALAKKPKDPKLQERFITAAVKYGHECMTSPDLDRKLKYKRALRVYREVLKLDPDNEVAKEESNLIISIYKQMGRKVPGG
jgi:tetratricopeptide (TPR) repeat protein